MRRRSPNASRPRRPGPKAPLERFVELLRLQLEGSGIVGSIVMLVGAGASRESGRPTWDDAALRGKLVDAVGKPSGSTKAFVAEAWAKLGRHLGATRSLSSSAAARTLLIKRARTDHLCEVAFALAEWRTALLEFLQMEYGPTKSRAQPQLAYELIAHLLKHRLADHVISLNFDEILDAALDDELGESGYQLILPRGVRADIDPNVPSLFKLHGTISHPESLRFSSAETGMLSGRVSDLLDRVLFGGKRGKKTWLVSLGYSWSDPDLIQWVARHQRDIDGVICVALDDGPANRLRSDLAVALRSGDNAPEIVSIPTRGITGASKPATIDEVLWGVWNSAKNSQPNVGLVPSEARHVVVSHMFPSQQPKIRNWPSVYYKYSEHGRFEAEVFLTTGKTDGLVTLSSVARDTRIIRHWAVDGRPSLRGRNVLDRMEFLQRSAYPDVTEVYLFKGTALQYARYFEDHRGDKLGPSGEKISDLREQSLQVPHAVGRQIRRIQTPCLRFLEDNLRQMFDGPSIEVDPGHDMRASLLFANPTFVPTYQDFRSRTARLMARKDWTTLLTIAESGYWLKEYCGTNSTFEGRKAFVIEASKFAVSDWVAHRPGNLPSEFVHRIGIPWWVHNRHLTLAIDQSGRLLAGLYFRRRQRTPRICPIELTDQRDLRELLKMFLAYVARFLEEFDRWTDRQGALEYDPYEFLEGLKTHKVAASLGAEGRAWQERLDVAWHNVKARQNGLSASGAVRPSEKQTV